MSKLKLKKTSITCKSVFHQLLLVNRCKSLLPLVDEVACVRFETYHTAFQVDKNHQVLKPKQQISCSFMQFSEKLFGLLIKQFFFFFFW